MEYRQSLLQTTLVLALMSQFGAKQALADVGSLDLDAAVQEAKGHSPTLAKSASVLAESGFKKTEVLGDGFLPKVSAQATHYFANKFQLLPVPGLGSFATVYPETMLELDASIPIFDGLANIRRLDAASLSQKSAQRSYEYTEFQIEESTRLAFYQALGARLIKDVYDQNVKTLEEHLKLAQLLQKHGAATNYDVLRVEVQLNEARSDAAEAQDNVEVSRMRLSQVMGLEQDSRELRGELPAPDRKRLEGLEVKSVQLNRGDIDALHLRADSMAKLASADDAYLVPKLSLVGNYQYYNNLDYTVNSSDFKPAYGVGALLTWNIFDGEVSMSRARESAEQKVQAEKTSREAELQVGTDSEQWKKKYLTGAGRFEVRSLDVQKSEEAVRLARTEQRAGSRTSTEVLDAEVDLFKARAGVVNAQLSAAEAQIQLELALGRRL